MAVKDENTRIQITIPKKLRELIQDQADYEGRTLSNMAAKILKEYYNFKVEE